MSNSELSPRDRARLQLNTPEFANRFVRVAGKQYPILHLSIAEMEKFRAHTDKFEDVFKSFCSTDLSAIDFLDVYGGDLALVLKREIPAAAAVVLKERETDLRRKNPIELLASVVSQWIHNLEIGKLRELFPFPESEDSDPTDTGNPMALIERLMSAYHCSKSMAETEFTYAHVYLMSQSAAEAYERAKGDSDDSTPGIKSKNSAIVFEGKVYNHPKEMMTDPEVYNRYFNAMMSGAGRG